MSAFAQLSGRRRQLREGNQTGFAERPTVPRCALTRSLHRGPSRSAEASASAGNVMYKAILITATVLSVAVGCRGQQDEQPAVEQQTTQNPNAAESDLSRLETMTRRFAPVGITELVASEHDILDGIARSIA